MSLLIATLAQGLIWSLLALGVFLTFRVLDIADLSVEGTFPLGAAVAAMWIAGGGSPWTALLLSLAAGAAAGTVTALLHTKLKIPALLAGILTMIALYSVNLHVMGKANISLLRARTVFTDLAGGFAPTMWTPFLTGLALAVGFGLLLYWFFGTELGTAIRATGNNPRMIRALGVDTDGMIVLGMLLSNALVALCGAFVAQSQGFADVGMGIGTIVIGLAAVIIGEVLFGRSSFKNSLCSVVLGSIMYRIVIAVVLYMGMPPNDLKLFTAVLVALALALPLVQKQWSAGKRGA